MNGVEFLFCGCIMTDSKSQKAAQVVTVLKSSRSTGEEVNAFEKN